MRDEASGGRRERRREGEEKERSVEGREIRREDNFKGGTLRRTLASIHYTVHSERTKQHTTQPLPLRLWYYGYCDHVMRRNVLFDRWMT